MNTAVQKAPPAPFSEAERSELLAIIAQRSFRHGKFTLSSGIQSSQYFNLKPTMMHPRGAYLSARAFLNALQAESAEYIGGLEMGAVPLIGAVAAVGEAEGRPVSTFFVRKKPKEHGTRDLVEGLAPDETLAGRRTVVADDVATSGASLFQAIEAAREAGARVDAALVLVDRHQGATELLAEHGVRLLSFYSSSEFAT